MSAPAVSVIIVTYQSAPVLERCLSHLDRQTFRDFEVLLVDNGSTDGAAQRAAQGDADLTLIETGANLGFAQANNIGAARARGRWLALLNPDAFAAPDWLERLMEATQAWPQTSCFTSLQVADDDPGLLDGAGDAMTLVGFPYRMGYRRRRPAVMPPGEVFSPCGAAMMVERRTFLDLGGFESAFFSYCEDVDFGWRLRAAGGRTRLVPEAVVAHVGSSTLGARSDFALFHGFRNRLWCFARNMPGLMFAVTLPLHLGATLGLLAVCAVRGEAGPAWSGLRQGLRGAIAQRRAASGARARGGGTLRAMTWNPLKAARRGLDIRRT